MRRLLIKLVAIETALVGWLAYWLFLVYADNPSVAAGLGSQISKFPQLAFTTVDLTVLVIIGVLSIFLAFKFQRGMKPGIRLERALQMLENLMKRNLILEAQVAEMKLDRAQVSTTAPAQSTGEPRLGSWEKAFRTPIEAGPPAPAPRPPSIPPDTGIEHDTGTPHPAPPRMESKPIPQVSFGLRSQVSSEKTVEKSVTDLDKTIEKSSTSSLAKSMSPTWEDSPKYLGETSGIFNPSEPPRKQATSISESSPQRQPYIPAPAPKVLPPSVILGPGVSPITTSRPLARASPSRLTSPQATQKPGPIISPTPALTTRPPTPSATSTSTETTKQSTLEKAQLDSTASPAAKDDSETPKPSGKSSTVKKRFPWEDT